jgi:hypothetical protein
MRSDILTKDLLELRDKINKLSNEQRDILLDFVDPLPEPQVEQKVAAAKKLTTTQPRKLDHCIADVNDHPCNISKRGGIHKDPNFPGYHAFQSSKGKSARAAGMAETLNKSLRSQRRVTESNCADCGMAEDMPIHSPEGGYQTYHPFKAGSSTAPTADNQSSASNGKASTVRNSEAETVSAGGVPAVLSDSEKALV